MNLIFDIDWEDVKYSSSSSSVFLLQDERLKFKFNVLLLPRLAFVPPAPGNVSGFKQKNART